MTLAGRSKLHPSFTFARISRTIMHGVLDSPRQLSTMDPEDMLGAIYRFPEPLLNQAPSSFLARRRRTSYTSIVLVGMGGSASAGDVLQDWLRNRIKIPTLVIREPFIPRFADSDTLVMCFSYSGDTRETLEAFKIARNYHCGLIGVGSGGMLRKLCRNQSTPFVQISSWVAPRAALSEMVAAGLAALSSVGIVGNILEEFRLAGAELAKLREQLRPTIPSVNNAAKRFAYQLRQKIPVVYGLQRMSSIARRFKNQLAENSKIIAKYDLFPESGHNEVESWSTPDPRFTPVLIRDWGETRQERAAILAFKSVIASMGGTRPIEVKLRTKSSLATFLGPILFLDYVSVYLAFLRHVDPSRTPCIQQYKGKYGAKF